MPEEFERPATDQALDRVVAALTANNIEAVVVDSGEEARRRVLELIPEGRRSIGRNRRRLKTLAWTRSCSRQGDTTPSATAT